MSDAEKVIKLQNLFHRIGPCLPKEAWPDEAADRA